jgi:hypothetical protein
MCHVLWKLHVGSYKITPPIGYDVTSGTHAMNLLLRSVKGAYTNNNNAKQYYGLFSMH